MTDSWWFPMAVLVLTCFAIGGVASLVNALLSPRGRSMIGGTIIVILAIACVVSYAIFVLSPSPPVDLPPEECLGPPYEVC